MIKKINLYNAFYIILVLLLIINSAFGFFGRDFNETQNSSVNFEITDITNEEYIYNKSGAIKNYVITDNVMQTNENNYIISPLRPFLYSNDFTLDYTIFDKAYFEHNKNYNFTLNKNIPKLEVPLFYKTNDGSLEIYGNTSPNSEITLKLYYKGNLVNTYSLNSDSNGYFSKNIGLPNSGNFLVNIFVQNKEGYFSLDRLIFYDNEAPEVYLLNKDGEVFNGVFYEKPIIRDNFMIEPVQYNFTIKDSIGDIVESGIKSIYSPLILNLDSKRYTFEITVSDFFGNSITKSIDFTISNVTNYKIALKNESNYLIPKTYYTSKDSLNFIFNTSPISPTITFNGNSISVFGNGDYYFTINNIDFGKNVLVIDAVNNPDSKTIYEIYRINSSENYLNIVDINKTNKRLIFNNTVDGINNYISFSKNVLIEGESNNRVYVNGKYVGKGNFSYYYNLNDNNNYNTIVIKSVDELGNSIEKRFNILYAESSNYLIYSIFNNFVNNRNFQFTFNTTNNYGAFSVYLNGELDSILLPQDKKITLNLELKEGINYLIIKNSNKEVFNSFIFYDNTPPVVELLNNNLYYGEGLVFHYFDDSGINSLSLNLTAVCGDSNELNFDNSDFKVLSNYLILNYTFSSSSCNFSLNLKDKSGNTFERNYNDVTIDRNFYIRNIKDISNNVNITKSSLIVLSEGDFKFEFNKDFIVNFIKIDDNPILNYEYSNPLSNNHYLIFSLHSYDIKPKGNLTLSIFEVDESGNIGTLHEYNFIYYSNNYRSNFSIDYIDKYVSIDDKGFKIFGSFDNEILDYQSLNINNEKPNFIFGNKFYTTSDSDNLEYSYCVFDNIYCESDNLNNILSFDSTSLDILNDDYIGKEFINNTLINVDQNTNNYVMISKFDGEGYNNYIIENPFKLYTKNTLLDYNKNKILFNEFSYNTKELFFNSNFDYRKPSYRYSFNDNKLNIYLSDYEKNNLKNITLVNLTGGEITEGEDSNKYFFNIEEDGTYYLTMEDKSGNILKDVFYLNRNNVNSDLEDSQIISNLDEITIDNSIVDIIVDGISQGNSLEGNNLDLNVDGEIDITLVNEDGSTSSYVISGGDSNNDNNNIPVVDFSLNSCQIYENENLYIDIVTSRAIQNLSINNHYCSMGFSSNENFYSFECPFDSQDNQNLVINYEDGLYFEENLDLSGCNFEFSNLDLNLNNLEAEKIFYLNGIYITNDILVDIIGNVSKPAFVKVLINGDEVYSNSYEGGSFTIKNLDFNDFVSGGEDDKSLDIQLEAETGEQHSVSNIVTLLWKKVLDNVVEVVIS